MPNNKRPSYAITLAELEEMHPCSAAYERASKLFTTKRKSVTAAQAAKAGIPLSDLLWVTGRKAANDPQLQAVIVQFALDCASQVHQGDDQPSYWPLVVSATTAIIGALRDGLTVTPEMRSRAAAADAAAAAAAAAARWSADAADAADAAAARWSAAADAADAADAAAAAARWSAAADAAADAAARKWQLKRLVKLLTPAKG